VRQASIALITFSWSWLSAGRDTWADLFDRVRSWLGDRDRQRQAVEWTLDCSQNVGGNVRVPRGRVQFRMPEQNLDNSDIDTGPIRWVAKEWRRVRGEIHIPSPAASAA
jgi:hypothetical protein